VQRRPRTTQGSCGSSPLLTIAIVFIFCALGLYTVGVWAERIRGKLPWWHAIVLWFGVACDATGTTAMAKIAGGLFSSTVHGITGVAAIALMLFHATRATIALLCRNERMIHRFHTFSLFVWRVWLVPIDGGMVLGSSV
jgi:uncharacterized repeat protein (TIGR03987 family)